jgi:hypothetical protein
MLSIVGILDSEEQGRSLRQYIIKGDDYYWYRRSEVLEPPCHRGIEVGYFPPSSFFNLHTFS